MIPVFGPKVYDKLKFVAQIALPALGTLYAAVAGSWNWPDTEQVVGTILAVDFFLGTLLGLSSTKFNNSDDRFDGEVNVEEHADGAKVVGLQLSKVANPNDVVKQDTLLFKVNKPT